MRYQVNSCLIKLLDNQFYHTSFNFHHIVTTCTCIVYIFAKGVALLTCVILFLFLKNGILTYGTITVLILTKVFINVSLIFLKTNKTKWTAAPSESS